MNDTAYIYSNFCHEDGKLFVPDTVRLQDFTKADYDATGVLYQIKVLPGRTLAVLIVDARQTQLAALGNPGAPAALTKIEFKDAVITNLKHLFVPFFDPSSCAQQREWSVLTPLNFFTVDSINGHNSLSELIKSLE